MSDQVQFDGENDSSSFRSRVILGQLKTPKMIRFLMNIGVVKDEKSGGAVLVVIGILCIVLTVYLYIFVLGGKKQNEIILNGAAPGQKLIPIEYSNEQ